LQRKCAGGGTLGPTGECEECRKKRLKRKEQQPALATRSDSSVPAIVSEMLRAPGQPLDLETRTFFESRFGHDFGKLRVHTDSKAAKAAEAVGASAYTTGSDLVFANAQYAPRGESRRRLLAHELVQVVQQSGFKSAPKTIGPVMTRSKARLIGLQQRSYLCAV
jgi:hypothetical protein